MRIEKTSTAPLLFFEIETFTFVSKLNPRKYTREDRDEPNNRQGAVYKIKCSDCQASYIGETGRNLNTRLTEHKRAKQEMVMPTITLLYIIN